MDLYISINQFVFKNMQMLYPNKYKMNVVLPVLLDTSMYMYTEQ